MVARMFVGEEATLTGWGRQWHNGPLADQLEMVRLPVVSNEECMRWYNSSGSRQFIPTYTFLCAGYEEGVLDACSGDSGGPLVIDRWAGPGCHFTRERGTRFPDWLQISQTFLKKIRNFQ